MTCIQQIRVLVLVICGIDLFDSQSYDRGASKRLDVDGVINSSLGDGCCQEHSVFAGLIFTFEICLL